MEMKREHPLYSKRADPLAEREAHLIALQEQLATQERDYQQKIRELGRAEQELEDERQIFLQDKKAFERAIAHTEKRSRIKGLLLVPLLLVSSIGVGYASFASLADTTMTMTDATAQLNALSERLRNTELPVRQIQLAQAQAEAEEVQVNDPIQLDQPVEPAIQIEQAFAQVANAQLQALDESVTMLQVLAKNPPAAGLDQLQHKTSITAKVDELLEQLSQLKLEMIDQNVLMDVDDAYIEIQEDHMSILANQLAQLERETLAKSDDYERLLQANRALVKEINNLRGERK